MDDELDSSNIFHNWKNTRIKIFILAGGTCINLNLLTVPQVFWGHSLHYSYFLSLRLGFLVLFNDGVSNTYIN